LYTRFCVVVVVVVVVAVVVVLYNINFVIPEKKKKNTSWDLYILPLLSFDEKTGKPDTYTQIIRLFSRDNYES
jgi:hypothetical protein